jgi:hypothetical protein
MTLVPDFSEWQPNVNIAGVRKQTDAIILRVGYGHDHKDLVIDRTRPQAVQQGFKFTGLYHYLVAGQDPVAQAEIYCNWVGHLNPGEIPIVDCEEGQGSLQEARCNSWFNIVDNHFGLAGLALDKRSWCYSGANFAGAYLGSIFASARHTWVAAYQSTEPSIGHTLWQSTNGAVGINRTSWAGAGYCDTSVTGYSADQLGAMGWQGSHPASGGITWSMWPTNVTLKEGDKGDAVKVLQTACANSGMEGVRGIDVDGDFGSQTLTAVRNFQSAMGLLVDGIAGPQTRNALVALNDL